MSVDIRLGGGYLPVRVSAAKREEIDALVAEYSRLEGLPLHERIELLDKAVEGVLNGY